MCVHTVCALVLYVCVCVHVLVSLKSLDIDDLMACGRKLLHSVGLKGSVPVSREQEGEEFV